MCFPARILKKKVSFGKLCIINEVIELDKTIFRKSVDRIDPDSYEKTAFVREEKKIRVSPSSGKPQYILSKKTFPSVSRSFACITTSTLLIKIHA